MEGEVLQIIIKMIDIKDIMIIMANERKRRGKRFMRGAEENKNIKVVVYINGRWNITEWKSGRKINVGGGT